MIFELRQKLERVARRIRSLRVWSCLALCWLLWAGIGAALVLAEVWTGWSPSPIWPILASMAGASAALCGYFSVRSARDQRSVARRIEAKHPELATLLLAAVEQALITRQPGTAPRFLQATVIREALEHGRQHDWTDAVSSWKLRFARLAQFATLGLLIAVCVGLAIRPKAHAVAGQHPLPITGDLGAISKIKIDPGNVEIERGSSLLVVAEFKGAIPPEATLITSALIGPAVAEAIPAESTSHSQLHNMFRSLDDPKFVARVAAVHEDLTYRVNFGADESDIYRVKVFEYPELLRADAELVFPEYTALSSTVVEDVRHITAVEGTRLTLICRLNKEVAEARLVDAEGSTVELKQDAQDKLKYAAGWTLAESRRFKLELADRDGRGTRLPAEIVVKVIPNRQPQIAIDRPGHDVEVSPLEELELKATVSDDFGVQRLGASYALGGGEPRDAEITGVSERSTASKQKSVNYLIDLESLKAEPDQLVSYFVWAEDFGPDGRLRRTFSDMYFAEVRPFDEVYRQGEQPSASEQQQSEQQQGQGAAQEAEALAELQKEIVNATWKLVRRETAPQPTTSFAADSRLVQQSQQSAIEKLSAIAQRVENAESSAHVESASKYMEIALKQLAASADGPAVAPLRPALAAEQDAYQALLKLRARESQVTRGAGLQRGGGGGGNRSQRQLDQLELAADENRYETQRRAAAPQEERVNRESREILNKLKDLARRQNDLNERLRELQSALQQAENEQRREELGRELKRLRDQQHEILRDTDQLMSRMDRPDSQQATEEARQQLDDGRSHVQQASEALEQGQLSQALTEGTRAGRQLSDVRDQFRQQAANRFSEDVSDLRRETRQLDEEQQRLSQQLNEKNAEAGRTLRDSGGRSEARERLTDQRRELGGLIDRMQQTIQEAEEPEPLLARQLYDTVREAHHQRIENALDVTQRLLDVGAEREATEAMRAADQGIRNLRQGVERAAESVLGDETEALRRAQREVEQLTQELNREIDEVRGQQSPGDERGQSDETGRGEPVENKSGQKTTRESQPGANQRNNSPSGQWQPNRDDGLELPTQDLRGQERGPNREASEENQARPEQAQRGQGETTEPDESGEPSDGGGAESGRERPPRTGRRSDIERFFEGEQGGRPASPGGPITGDDFRLWSQRIGDVEEMLDDPQLRSEAARIRDRAANARAEFKRHSKAPNWKKLQTMVAEPLNELSRRIDEQILLRESPDSLVPIDRDPVPPEYSEQVRRYYERLGSGE